MKAKAFMDKIRDGEDTGTMWISSGDIIDVVEYALIENYRDPKCLRLRGIQMENKTLFNTIRDGSHNYFGNNRPVFVAMNHNMAHFVLVWINERNILHYVDSMSGNDEHQEKMLKKKFPGFDYYEVAHLNQQTDGWSCGYRVAREILLLSNLDDHPLVKAKSSNSIAIRDAFVAIAKKCHNKYPLVVEQLFEYAGVTAEGKLTYVVIPGPGPLNFDFGYCDLKDSQDLAKSKEEIKNFIHRDEKYRYALLETGTKYIYFKINDSKLGAGPNGMGENAFGMLLMEVRNELLRENKAAPSLIIDNLDQLRERARQERQEIDEALGVDKTKGMSLENIRKAFRELPKLKEGPHFKR